MAAMAVDPSARSAAAAVRRSSTRAAAASTSARRSTAASMSVAVTGGAGGISTRSASAPSVTPVRKPSVNAWCCCSRSSAHARDPRPAALGLQLAQVALGGHALTDAPFDQSHDLVDGALVRRQEVGGLSRPYHREVRVDDGDIDMAARSLDLSREEVTRGACGGDAGRAPGSDVEGLGEPHEAVVIQILRSEVLERQVHRRTPPCLRRVGDLGLGQSPVLRRRGSRARGGAPTPVPRPGATA